MRELVVPSKCELEGNSEGFDRHDGDGADGRADGDIYQRVRFPISWCDSVDHYDGKNGNHEAIYEETWEPVSKGPGLRPHLFVPG